MKRPALYLATLTMLLMTTVSFAQVPMDDDEAAKAMLQSILDDTEQQLPKAEEDLLPQLKKIVERLEAKWQQELKAKLQAEEEAAAKQAALQKEVQAKEEAEFSSEDTTPIVAEETLPISSEESAAPNGKTPSEEEPIGQIEQPAEKTVLPVEQTPTDEEPMGEIEPAPQPLGTGTTLLWSTVRGNVRVVRERLQTIVTRLESLEAKLAGLAQAE